MKPFVTGVRTLLVASGSLALGCASNPDKISPTYVSTLQYESYSCSQIGVEQGHIEERTTNLYTQLKKDRGNDNAQMGIGLVLFWPALFFLEGGDGPEAAEYARLKGEYEALRKVSVQKECGLAFQSNLSSVAAKVEKREATDGSATQSVSPPADEKSEAVPSALPGAN